MNEPLLGIPNLDIYLVFGILLFFIFIEIISGYWHRSQRSSGDWMQEMLAYVVLALITKPLIVFCIFYFGQLIFPTALYSMSQTNLALAVLVYLAIDDFLQYWYHRSAHEYGFLWKLHRSHHQAEEMGFFVSYRNAALYYLLMPNIWWIGVCLFLGGAQAVAIGLIAKQLIIISSHSRLHYDAFFYKNKFLQPLIFLWERIFITPAFHHAHHGQSKLDGISNPNGNFGNMFSIWDQLFGTATFTHEFSDELGLPNDPKEKWTAAYLYPLIASDNPDSELSRGYKKEKTTEGEPSLVHLEKGKKYLWCQCGKSKNQPFCDASHHGTKFKPLLFEAKRSGEVKLCNCKLTKRGPFCDDSHVSFKA